MRHGLPKGWRVVVDLNPWAPVVREVDPTEGVSIWRANHCVASRPGRWEFDPAVVPSGRQFCDGRILGRVLAGCRDTALYVLKNARMSGSSGPSGGPRAGANLKDSQQ